jgi:tetratricopeptide (TPR) repeat protein
LADRSKAIELNPRLPEAWFARGSAYYLLGDYGKAQSDLAQALHLRPDYKEAAEVFAKAQKRLEEAKPVEAKNTAPPPAPAPTATPAPTAAPAPTPAAPARPPVPKPAPTAGTASEHEARGRAFTQSEKYPEALAELNQAIQLAPNVAHAYNARGYVYLRQHDYPHALADFNDAIRL